MYKKHIILFMLLVLVLSITGCKPWTIVKNGEKVESEDIEIYFDNTDFDADVYANKIWSDQISQYYEENQVDVVELINGLRKDETETGAKYAIGSNDTGSKWQFIVVGEVEVLNVDTQSRAGILNVDISPYDGIADFDIQIGPVIKGSSIRDSLDFIKLDDFNNQVEFAGISKAFNKIVVEQVIGNEDFSLLVGKRINVVGCFTYESAEKILLTPISLSFPGGE